LAIVNIVDVSSRDLSEERLWGCNIDLPVPGGGQTEPHALSIIGWVLGRSAPAVAVELVSEGTVLSRVPIDVRRPDIAAAFPEISGAERSGFQTILDLSEMAPGFELLVRAVFEDDGRAKISVIRGQHSSPRNEVEIAEVSTVPTGLSALLWGAYIDLPAHGSLSDIYAISVGGWALGRSSPVVAVELVSEKDVLRRIPINVQRPDIAARFPSIPEAENSGFRVTVNVLGLTPEGFELSVKAILQDEKRVQIGVIRGRRRSLRSDFRPKLQPLMVTTYGRTGSNWLMRLLGEHPQILTYRPFEYEPRVSSYWMQILKTLSEPASYLQTLGTRLSDEYWWLGHESSPSELVIPDPQIQQWLGRNSIEALATFCQNRIKEFYDQVAVVQGQTDAIYFAEKELNEFTRRMIQELYPHSHEILLVRDFRDMVCSILDYNAKQKSVSFGREGVSSDEEFIELIRRYALTLLRNYEDRSPQAHLLRYEDLVLRPDETLSALLEYLDLEPTPSMVEGMIERASEETLAMQEHRTSPDPEKSIGRWRRDLDPAMRAACQEAFGDVLEEFGYTAYDDAT
jgi:hypothetical protein